MVQKGLQKGLKHKLVIIIKDILHIGEKENGYEKANNEDPPKLKKHTELTHSVYKGLKKLE